MVHILFTMLTIGLIAGATILVLSEYMWQKIDDDTDI